MVDGLEVEKQCMLCRAPFGKNIVEAPVISHHLWLTDKAIQRIQPSFDMDFTDDEIRSRTNYDTSLYRDQPLSRRRCYDEEEGDIWGLDQRATRPRLDRDVPRRRARSPWRLRSGRRLPRRGGSVVDVLS